MEIAHNGSMPSYPGPSDWFTGAVRIEALFDETEETRTSGRNVTFEPGARTAWHTHPRGQILIVTAGFGRVQRDGGPVETIRPGDIVRIAPNERHWHGAGPETAMTHISLTESKDGKGADWMEHVSDEDYMG